MLKLARRKLGGVIDALRPEIRAGTPVVGLEPSCVSTFRDELPNLFPHDEDARRLSQQTVTLAEFLCGDEDRSALPQMKAKALVHYHCHHRAIMSLKSEEQIFRELGLDFRVLDSGCCGMAGAFGFEERNYEVSIACARRVLIPEVLEAEQETLIIADGFSCRQQIVQLSGRHALHLAEVLRMALEGEGTGENLAA